MKITRVAKKDGNDDMGLVTPLLLLQMFLDSTVHGYCLSSSFGTDVLIYQPGLSFFSSTRVVDRFYL